MNNRLLSVVVRIAGYVREAPGPDEGETAFIQAEKIRTWAQANDGEIVAMCQDVRGSDEPGSGYRALTEVVRSGAIEAVVLSSISALSADKINQEILMRDLIRRGTRVLSADRRDVREISVDTSDASRRLIRDVLAKVDEISGSEPAGGNQEEDVVIRLFPAGPG